MALTKVTGQVINSTTDLSVGVATVGGGTSTGELYVVGVSTLVGDLTLNGNVTIGGTLTYEDVTNVDSVGLITARKGITVLGAGVTIAAGGLNVNAGISTFNEDVQVGSGITLSPDGDLYSVGISTFKDIIYIADKILHDGDGNTGIRFPDADTFAVETGGTQRLRITSGGDVLLGGLLYDRGPVLAVETNTYDGIGVYRNSADAGTSLFTLAKSRGTSAGAVTAVNSADKVGRIRFQGADGDELSDAAYIDCDIDTTPGNNDMPGRLVFATSADGSNSPAERMRLDSSGRLLVGTTAGWGSDVKLHIGSSANTYSVITSGTTHNGVLAFSDDGTERGAIDYDHDGDYMALKTSASEALRIDSSGRLLLGATKTHSSATYYDDIVVNNSGAGSGAAGGCGVTLISHPSSWGAFMFGDSDDDDIGYTKYDHSNDALKFGTGSSDRVIINSDGLAIASDGSPATAGYGIRVKTSHGSGGNVAQFYNDNADNYGGLIINAGVNDREVRLISAYGSSFMTFYTESAGGAQNEWMRIKQDGHVNFHTGGNSPGASQRGAQFEVNGTNTILQLSAGAVSSGNHIEFYNTNGQVGRIYSNNSATTYSTSSDYRLKENVVSISDGISRVKALKPYRFNWKSDSSKTTIDGFFAHEVSFVVPEAIGGVKDAVEPEDNEDKKIKKGDIIPQSMDQSKLVPLLTAAIQELVARVEALESA